MNIEAQLPDGRILEFPEGTASEVIDRVVKEELTRKPVAKVSLPKEMGKVLDQTVRGGVTALPGFVADAFTFGSKTMASDFPKGTRHLPGGGLIEGFSHLGKAAIGVDTTFGDATRGIQTLGGLLPPLSKPDTEAGKAAGNIGESVIASLVGGGPQSLAQKATIGLGGGVGGEAAARSTGDNPIARFLGSLVGGLGTASAQKVLRPNASEIVAESTQAMRPSDWPMAKKLEEILNAMGLPHLKSQLLGPRSTLKDQVELASMVPAVKPKLEPHLASVPDKVERIVATKSQEHLPLGVDGKREALNDIQEAAAKRLAKIKKKGNTEFEKVMPKQGELSYPPEHVKKLYDELNDLANSPRYGETSKQGEALKAFAERLKNDSDDTWDDFAAKYADRTVQPQTWDEVMLYGKQGLQPYVVHEMDEIPEAISLAELKNLRGYQPDQIIFLPKGTKFEDSGWVTDAHKINNLIKGDNLRALKKEGFEGLPDKDIKELVQKYTPEFDAARKAKTAVMLNEFNPTSKSLTGDLARMGGGVKPDRTTANKAAVGWLYNSGPKGGEISELSKNVGGTEVAAVLREHFGDVMRKNWDVRGPKHNVPGNFADDLYGARWKRENIDATLAAYAEETGKDPKELIKGFQHIIKGLDTYRDVNLSTRIASGQAAEEASKGAVSTLIAPIRAGFSHFRASANKKTYQQLAEMVLSKDGLDQLEAIAREPKPERIKAAVLSMMAAALQAERGERPAEEEK
jgi:hypothetical protein